MFEVAKNAIEIMASRISAPDKPHTTDFDNYPLEIKYLQNWRAGAC